MIEYQLSFVRITLVNDEINEVEYLEVGRILFIYTEKTQQKRARKTKQYQKLIELLVTILYL